MKRIKLLRDHHVGNQLFLAGQTIPVTNEQYEYLQKYYLRLRGEQVQENKVAKEFLKKAGVLNDATSD